MIKPSNAALEKALEILDGPALTLRDLALHLDAFADGRLEEAATLFEENQHNGPWKYAVAAGLRVLKSQAGDEK